jgi:hypothetical protein
MLSPTVLGVVASLPSFVMLSMTCVFVREMWSSICRDVVDHGEDRCCGLSKGRNGGDG